MSYGYHRAEVLGAIASILLIWSLLIWLVFEAYDRIFLEDHITNPLVMLITSSVGFCCNLVNILVL